jgi:hypothetical protein
MVDEPRERDRAQEPRAAAAQHEIGMQGVEGIHEVAPAERQGVERAPAEQRAGSRM